MNTDQRISAKEMQHWIMEKTAEHFREAIEESRVHFHAVDPDGDGTAGRAQAAAGRGRCAEGRGGGWGRPPTLPARDRPPGGEGRAGRRGRAGASGRFRPLPCFCSFSCLTSGNGYVPLLAYLSFTISLKFAYLF